LVSLMATAQHREQQARGSAARGRGAAGNAWPIPNNQPKEDITVAMTTAAPFWGAWCSLQLCAQPSRETKGFLDATRYRAAVE
jgi:hypothetical protein